MDALLLADPSISADVFFEYSYDSTTGEDPQIAIRVINGASPSSNDDVPFDLNLSTSSSSEFDLAYVDAVGSSGIRNISVQGDLLTSLTAAQSEMLGLPVGTPGGVNLPADHLGGLAVADNITQGTVTAASIQALAMGSLTTDQGVIAGTSVTSTDAKSIVTPGTAFKRADETLLIPVVESQSVALFLDTGPSDLDSKNVIFSDQSADDLSVSVYVAVERGSIGDVVLLGTGGAIDSRLPIDGAISSSGPLGDIFIQNSGGIGDVTAPSFFGSIDTQGPIHGTIQSLAGDIGSAFYSSGQLTGSTFINTNGGISGRIIARGNLVSQVSSQSDLGGNNCGQRETSEPHKCSRMAR